MGRLVCRVLGVVALALIVGGMAGATAGDTYFKNVGVIVFGELHGTTEMPAAFVGFVEDATYGHRGRILVGLELPPDALDLARDAARRCNGDEQCGGLLATSSFWSQARDGRSSRAFFDMVAALSKLERAGKIRLIGFDLRKTGRERFGDLVAEQLASQTRPLNAMLMTGSGHATMDGSGNSISSSLLRDGFRVAVVTMTGAGGSAWYCTGGKCGIHELLERSCEDGAKKLALASGAEQDYCVGATTASLPLVDGAMTK